eukprot:608782_1
MTFSDHFANFNDAVGRLSTSKKIGLGALWFLASLLILVGVFGQLFESPPVNCSEISLMLAGAGYVIPQFDSEDMMALNSTMTVPCMHPLVDTVMHLNCTTVGEVYLASLDCPSSARCIDLETSALSKYPAFVDMNVNWPSRKADA